VTNVGQAFLETASRNPDLLAIVDDVRAVNYAQLDRLVRSFASRMRGLGVREGNLVAVATDDIFVSIPVFLAIAIIGARWVAARHVPGLSGIATPTHFLCSPEEREASDPRFKVIDDSWTRDGGPSAASGPGVTATDDEAPWLHFSTSGTTGTPKILALSQATMSRRFAALRDDFVERKTVFCGLFPCAAPPYATFTLASVINGCTVLRSRDFALWDASGMNLLHGSVKQVSDLLGQTVLPRKLPQVHVGGAKTPDRLAAHLLKSFDKVVEVFASTETNRSFKTEKRLAPDGTVESVGVKLDSDIEIVDDAGNPCADGDIGLVRVRNGYLAKGYLNNPEAEARSFRAGWFYPGDLGFWGKNGALRIAGRSGDVINLGGVKINAAEIDEALKSVDGIADAVCFENAAGTDVSELLAFVIFDEGIDVQACTARAAAHCLGALGPLRSPARLVPVNTIPRASDGGAQRFMCKTIYAQMKRPA
jgi:acyl-CoA synthetase (AMP-forming)/AMP-acid ligase II